MTPVVDARTWLACCAPSNHPLACIASFISPACLPRSRKSERERVCLLSLEIHGHPRAFPPKAKFSADSHRCETKWPYRGERSLLLKSLAARTINVSVAIIRSASERRSLKYHINAFREYIARARVRQHWCSRRKTNVWPRAVIPTGGYEDGDAANIDLSGKQKNV